MSAHPKVAVLIRAHLDAPFLLEALESVNGQDYVGEIEVFLILDRLEKNILNDVVKNKNRVSIILLENNSGDIASGLNLAIESTSANYIAVLDSDDRMHRSRIRKQMEFLIELGYSAVGSNLNLISENGLKIGEQEMPQGTEVESKLSENSTIAHPSSIFVKKDVVSVGCYRSFYEYAEDYDLWLRLSENNRIGNIDQFLTDYRVHSGQLTKSNLKRHVWAVLAVKESLRSRISGVPELHERFPNISTWKKQGKKKLGRRIAFQILYSKSLISKSNSIYSIRNLGHIVLLLILNPNFFIAALVIRIRKGLKK
jgi:glycosyltransferase involved in cell wall biosynthesis